MNEHFYKQRRNLILASAVVAFVNATVGTIEKISILGTELKLANPSIMPVALGLILLYLFVRYLQYAHEIEDKGFKKRFLGRTEKYLAPRILKREHKVEKSDIRRAYPDIKKIKIEYFLMDYRGIHKNRAYADFVGKEGGIVIQKKDLPVTISELIWPFIRASAYILFRTRLGTDYIFPIVFTLFAFATYWPGFPKMLFIRP